MPGIKKNYDAAVANGAPTVLTRITDRQAIRVNRRAATYGYPQRGGMSREEYPHASSAEGGAGATVSNVPSGENPRQGGLLSSFFRKYGIEDGDQYRVVYE